MKSTDERVQLKREYDSWVNERQMQTTKEKVDTSQALDASSVDTESNRTESKEQDTSSSSGNDAHDDVADIRPIYDEEPMAELKEMVHNHYLEESKKRTQEHSKNLEPSLMHSARSKSIVDGSKPMPKRNTQTSRNWPATKNSFVTTKIVPIAEHPRNSKNDSRVKKFLKEVNSRARVPSKKTTNRNKPVEQRGVSYKQERQILTGHRFLIQKTSVVQKKIITPRSCLRWKPTGKIFKTVSLRWVPTGRILTSSTTKVDSEPLNGSNANITNQYECEQTLDVSACTSFNLKEEGLRVCSELRLHDHSNEQLSSRLVPNVVPPADKTATSRQMLGLLFHHHITMLRKTTKKETSVANNTSGLVPQRQKASNYDNPDPIPPRQDVSSSVDADVPSQQELDLLFGPLYDEFFNEGSNSSTNVQSTSAPSTHTNVHAEENNNDQAEKGEQLQD
nr:hypothetical protein [Tanacetum cinerariifolium]